MPSLQPLEGSTPVPWAPHEQLHPVRWLVSHTNSPHSHVAPTLGQPVDAQQVTLRVALTSDGAQLPWLADASPLLASHEQNGSDGCFSQSTRGLVEPPDDELLVELVERSHSDAHSVATHRPSSERAPVDVDVAEAKVPHGLPCAHRSSSSSVMSLQLESPQHVSTLGWQARAMQAPHDCVSPAKWQVEPSGSDGKKNTHPARSSPALAITALLARRRVTGGPYNRDLLPSSGRSGKIDRPWETPATNRTARGRR